MVSLFEGRLSETLPTVGSVDGPGSLESNIKVAALDGKVEPGALILDEVECDLLLNMRPAEDSERSGVANLWVPLLL